MEKKGDSADRRFLAAILTLSILASGFYMIPASAPPVIAEDVTGPFAERNDGYPLYILDQQQPNLNTDYTLSGSTWRAQSFTPSVTGRLGMISVYISSVIAPGYLTARIYNTDQLGKPLPGDVISAQSVHSSLLPVASKWFNITFDNPAELASGMEYAIVLSCDAGITTRWVYNSGYPGGMMSYSIDSGVSWATLTVDLTFKTYMTTSSTGIRRVAWHPSGNFALGVTGQNSAVWEYYRELGSWSLAIADSGEVWNDIIYEPVWDRFYAAGHDQAGPNHPVSWEINPYDQPMTKVSLGSPPLTEGSFMALCAASEGVGPYAFLAVGQNSSMPGVLACWYQMGVGWKSANSGDVLTSDGHVLYDVTWDRQLGGSYYAAGADGASGKIYKLASAGNPAPSRISDAWPVSDAYFSIEWQPYTAGAQYALLGCWANTYGMGNLQKFDGNAPVKMMANTDNIFDISWHPDGSYAVIVGSNAAQTAGAAYRHIAGEPDAIPMSFMLPPGTGPLSGVAMKGPSSPSSGIIVSSGGAVVFYPSALNQDTGITVNAAYPHLYWIGFNTSLGASRVEQQVPPDDWYQFSLAANYSQGWTNCEVIIEAWHDRGAVGDASLYPAETDANRCLAFRLHYDPSFPSYTMTYPGGPEFAVGGYTENIIGGPVGEEIYELRFDIRLGPQTRSANGNGFTSGDVNTDPLKTNTLLDANSWDFSVRVQDRNFVTAGQTMYSEFGVHTLVGITATGNPAANAPPGASDVPMANPSLITYSSNTVYWVNVSIPNVGLNGNPLATDFISPTDVAIANANILASQEYTELNSTDCPVGRAFQGADIPWCVWGNRTAAGNPYMPAPANGTSAFGPWGSDFNLYHNPTGTTRLNWWVTVQATTKEGVYSALITLTIDT